MIYYLVLYFDLYDTKKFYYFYNILFFPPLLLGFALRALHLQELYHLSYGQT
jgi:hypothetical protein